VRTCGIEQAVDLDGMAARERGTAAHLDRLGEQLRSSRKLVFGATSKIRNSRMVLCVGALILRDQKVLLGLRAPHRSSPRCWDIIGGHVEDGETAEAALVRELQEEIGITPTASRFLSAFTFMDGNREAELRIFEVREWAGEPRLRNDEHTEIKWHRLTEVGNLRPLAAAEYIGVFRSLLR
jgi:8-oxo-dGTP diphosphatase